MQNLNELEAAADALPVQEKRELVQFLLSRLREQGADIADTQSPGHSVLDIETFNLGAMLRPLGGDDDLLGEMLEGRE